MSDNKDRQGVALSDAVRAVKQLCNEIKQSLDIIDKRHGVCGATEAIHDKADAIVSVLDSRASSSRAEAYEKAIDDELVLCHLGVASGNAREELHQIIAWHMAVSLDPKVSRDAQALIAAGRAEVEQAVPETIFGPYDVAFMGAGVWAGIPDELPPELVGKQVFVSLAAAEAPNAEKGK